jgi:hypothetical protein
LTQFTSVHRHPNPSPIASFHGEYIALLIASSKLASLYEFWLVALLMIVDCSLIYDVFQFPLVWHWTHPAVAGLNIGTIIGRSISLCPCVDGEIATPFGGFVVGFVVFAVVFRARAVDSANSTTSGRPARGAPSSTSCA